MSSLGGGVQGFWWCVSLYGYLLQGWCLWLWCYWVGPLHRRKGIAHHSRCGHVVGAHMVTSQQRFFMLSTKIEAVQQQLCDKEGGGGSNCRQTNVLFFSSFAAWETEGEGWRGSVIRTRRSETTRWQSTVRTGDLFCPIPPFVTIMNIRKKKQWGNQRHAHRVHGSHIRLISLCVELTLYNLFTEQQETASHPKQHSSFVCPRTPIPPTSSIQGSIYVTCKQ